MQGGVVYEVLPADLEGVVIADVGSDHLHSRSAFIKHLFRGGNGIGHAGAALVAKADIQSAAADVFLVF